MLTGKQRSYLKALANKMDPIFQVGKNGIGENFIIQIEEALEARELIKINILNNSLLEVKEVSDELIEKTGAEYVQIIGNKLVLYRESEEDKTIQLP